MSSRRDRDKKSSGSEDGEIKEPAKRRRDRSPEDYYREDSPSMSRRHEAKRSEHRRHRRHREDRYDDRYDDRYQEYRDEYRGSSSRHREEDRDRRRHRHRHHRDDPYYSPADKAGREDREDERSHDLDDLRNKIKKRHSFLEDEGSREGSRRSTPVATSSAPHTPAKIDAPKPRKVTGYVEVHDIEMSDEDDDRKQAVETPVENEEPQEGPILGPDPPSPPLISDDDSPAFVPYYPAIEGCRSVEEFSCLNRIEEGTYGVVYRAECKKTREIVALKRLKMEKEKEGFPITSLREINTLMKAPHENIVRVKEIVVGSNMDKIFIVMEYVEHDLKSLMDTMKKPFLLGEVKTLLMQLLSAIAHLHDNWILHRDLKTSNLLLSHRGILKVGDFGLAREYGSPLKAYTPVVVTLWYRAPELLLECPKYSTPIDVWSIGCIFGELLTMKPFFPGKSEIDQLNLIFKDLGTPSDKIWPGYSDLPVVKKVTFVNQPYNSLSQRLGNKLNKTGLDLLTRFLAYCPDRRLSAAAALNHDFFTERPIPIDPWAFPTWPAKSEGSTRPKVQSPKAPVGGGFADREAGENDDILMGGFKGAGFSLKFC